MYLRGKGVETRVKRSVTAAHLPGPHLPSSHCPVSPIVFLSKVFKRGVGTHCLQVSTPQSLFKLLKSSLSDLTNWIRFCQDYPTTSMLTNPSVALCPHFVELSISGQCWLFPFSWKTLLSRFPVFWGVFFGLFFFFFADSSLISLSHLLGWLSSTQPVNAEILQSLDLIPVLCFSEVSS